MYNTVIGLGYDAMLRRSSFNINACLVVFLNSVINNKYNPFKQEGSDQKQTSRQYEVLLADSLWKAEREEMESSIQVVFFPLVS